MTGIDTTRMNRPGGSSGAMYHQLDRDDSEEEVATGNRRKSEKKAKMKQHE